MPFEDSQQQGDAIRVDAGDGSARRAGVGVAHEGLYFHEEGPRPFHGREHDGAADAHGTFIEEEGAGIAHLGKACVVHFEDADLV